MDEMPVQPPGSRNPDPLARAIRGLTIALWAVALAIVLQIAYSIFAYTFSFKRFVQNVNSEARKHASIESSTPSSASSFSWPQSFEGKQFNELTTEKKIHYASVIFLTKHEKTPKRWREMISEIVKIAPGTEFHYRVGEEYPELSMPGDYTCSGDGNIVFLVGSPAMMSESSSYTGDRLDSLGGLTLADLREEAKKEGK